MKMAQYKAPPIGQEISCVMKGLEREVLLDGNLLLHFFLKELVKRSFDIINTSICSFEPWGYTGFIVLGESHLAFHTYPEYSTLYFSMYSCRGLDDAEPILDYALKGLKPKKILYLQKNEVPIEE